MKSLSQHFMQDFPLRCLHVQEGKFYSSVCYTRNIEYEKFLCGAFEPFFCVLDEMKMKKETAFLMD